MFYCFIFADGFRFWAKKLTKHDLKIEEFKHGKLISKTKA